MLIEIRCFVFTGLLLFSHSRDITICLSFCKVPNLCSDQPLVPLVAPQRQVATPPNEGQTDDRQKDKLNRLSEFNFVDAYVGTNYTVLVV